MTYDPARYSSVKDAVPKYKIVDGLVHVKIGPADNPDLVMMLTAEQAIEMSRQLIQRRFRSCVPVAAVISSRSGLDPRGL